MRSVPWALVWAALLLACGRAEAPPATERLRIVRSAPLEPSPRAAPPSPYMAPGKLAPGSERVFGVPIPRIAKIRLRQERLAQVEVEKVPYPAVEAFFLERLSTGRVERTRRGVRIEHAVARDGSGPHVNAVLLKTGRGTTVTFFNNAPSGKRPPATPQEVEEARGRLSPQAR